MSTPPAIRAAFEQLRAGGGAAPGGSAKVAVGSDVVVAERAADGSVRLFVEGDLDSDFFRTYGVHSVDSIAASNPIQTTARADNAIRVAYGHRPSASPKADAANTMRLHAPTASPWMPAGAPPPAPALGWVPTAAAGPPASAPAWTPAASLPASGWAPAVPAPPAASASGWAPAAPAASAAPSFGGAPTGAPSEWDSLAPAVGRAGPRVVPAASDFDRSGSIKLLPYMTELYLGLLDLPFNAARVVYERADRSQPGAANFLAAFARSAKAAEPSWDPRSSMFASIQSAQQLMRSERKEHEFSWQQMSVLILNTIMAVLGKPARFAE